MSSDDPSDQSITSWEDKLPLHHNQISISAKTRKPSLKVYQPSLKTTPQPKNKIQHIVDTSSKPPSEQGDTLTESSEDTSSAQGNYKQILLEMFQTPHPYHHPTSKKKEKNEHWGWNRRVVKIKKVSIYTNRSIKHRYTEVGEFLFRNHWYDCAPIEDSWEPIAHNARSKVISYHHH